MRKIISLLIVIVTPILLFTVLNVHSTSEIEAEGAPAETGQSKMNIEASQAVTTAINITIDASVPPDIPGGAASATITTAAVFAWQEFIALNWPAAPGRRDTPDTSKRFGDPSYSDASNPLVWHTFRNKVEIYMDKAITAPHGYVNDAGQAYGYDDPAQYVYSPALFTNGQVPACSGQESASTPWINLDEENEIGLDAMFAGVAQEDTYPGQQILFLAKANRLEYEYVAANGWWGGGNDYGTVSNNTQTYLLANKASPTPADPNNLTAPNGPNGEKLFSFPTGVIEIKTAWRRLTPDEMNGGRFYTTTVRYYRPVSYMNNQATNDPTQPPPKVDASKDFVCYLDETWGMVALHIIHKTPTAPYFVYATFGQADNILDESGNKVEDADGRLLLDQDSTPMRPAIVSTNATSNTDQILSAEPPVTDTNPHSQLYYLNKIYKNTPPTAPQGKIAINRRVHTIPDPIIAVNAAAHQALVDYGAGTPWQYYKLVNVQWKPVTKTTPGVDYGAGANANDPQISGVPVSSYYLANIVVETDYSLQVFSGYNLFNDLITDFNYQKGGMPPNQFLPAHSPAVNLYYDGQEFNMGGCMGCHGVAQALFAKDFSFILASAGGNSTPEFAGKFLSEQPK